MKQVIQDKRSGRVSVEDVPAPSVHQGAILVRTQASLISSGTERAAIELGRRSLLGKAIDRPDLVRRVLDVARTRGVKEAMRAVSSRLDQPTLLGYSCSGTVVAVGPDVLGFAPGDLVACAGYGHASHAEFVSVPVNLAVPMPSGVPPEHACFVALGAIAIHGVRLAGPAIGETVVVIGLGLLGLLTVQILKAAGCRVIGVDLSPSRCALAADLGVDRALPRDGRTIAEIERETGGRGADACIITAAAKSSDPIHLAGEAARDRAVISVVGDVGLDVPRNLYYGKELTLRVARSYGPGRYDTIYEAHGVDYPIGYVRWTARRNMEEFLRLLSAGAVRIAPLITGTYPVSEAPAAYAQLTGDQGAAVLALVLTYPAATEPERRTVVTRSTVALGRAPTVSFLGAGSFARSVLLPRFRENGVRLRGVATATGPSAHQSAMRFGFSFATTDPDEVFRDPETDAVVIATRHDSHADLTVRALGAGKHVFVEKPLALTSEELTRVVEAARASDRVLFVGYNRRFAPLVGMLKEALGKRSGAVAITYRVNAGPLSASHWTRDPRVGGGRIVGEACHFVDLLQFLTDEDPVAVAATAVPPTDGGSVDTVSFQVRFSGGSLGAVHYFSLGDRALGKERLEVFGSSFAAVLDDFRYLEVFRPGGRHRTRSGRQDKGHDREVKVFLEACRSGGPPPVALGSLARTSLVTFAILEALRTGSSVSVPTAI
ncbi:MAG TPA: bi-domain-containing oxidoreductase [Gemmatimonadales bacterium]|nr:bi-domain-containing oxidoreductase [Gemmatimonadales bacterium]